MAARSTGFGLIRKLGCLWLALSITAIATPFLQSPGAKFQKKSGAIGNPAVSAAQLTTVPNVVGRSASQAIRDLRESRLVPNVQSINETGAESYIVLSQDPLAGTKVLPEKSVNIIVGKPGIRLGLDTDHPEVLKPVTVTTTVTPEIPNTYYYFDWGDGHQDSRQTSPMRSHPYANTGTYAISVTALVNDIKLSASTSVIVVQPAPNYSIGIEAADPTLEAGSKGTFTAKLMPPAPPNVPIDYCFHWGDGSAATCSRAGTADHSFTGSGQYDVVATATLATGKEISSPAVRIDVLSPPKVRLNPETTFPVLGQKTAFTIAVTGQLPSNAPVRYCFSWESGGTEECQDSSDISRAFTAAGVYRVAAVAEQNGKRFEATPVVLRVYELSLTPVPSRAETGKAVKFVAKVAPESLSGLMEYCFHWGDGSQSCGSQSSVEHQFSSTGTYRASAELFVNKRSVATSAVAQVEIAQPVWLTAILWIGGLISVLGISYGIKKGIKRTTKPPLPVAVRVVPKLGEAPRYQIIKSQALPKYLVRIRWVRPPAKAAISPQGNLVKKKGSAHAG